MEWIIVNSCANHRLEDMACTPDRPFGHIIAHHELEVSRF